MSRRVWLPLHADMQTIGRQFRRHHRDNNLHLRAGPVFNGSISTSCCHSAKIIAQHQDPSRTAGEAARQ